MQQLERRNTYTPADIPHIRSNCGQALNREETLSVSGLKTLSNTSDATFTAKSPEQTPDVTPILKRKFTNITSGATEPQAIDIASCLTDSIFMKNKCSGYNYGVVSEAVDAIILPDESHRELI